MRRIVAMLVVGAGLSGRADFTLVTEGLGDPPRQTTVSLRGMTLRVPVRPGADEGVLLRGIGWGFTVVTESGRALRVTRDRRDIAPAGSLSRTDRFLEGGKPHRVLGRTCRPFTATASSPELSYGGCYVPWKDLGLDVDTLARLMPT